MATFPSSSALSEILRAFDAAIAAALVSPPTFLLSHSPLAHQSVDLIRRRGG
jgi:hypothetical protein